MLPSKKEYKKMTERASPDSALLKDMALAFVFGGGVCALGQFFVNFYMSFGVAQKESSALCSITLILITALLTGFKVFDNIASVGKAGLLVPITGFANSVVSPAMEFKSEGLVLGLAVKMFTIAGPVIVYGVSASVVYGIIYWITTII